VPVVPDEEPPEDIEDEPDDPELEEPELEELELEPELELELPEGRPKVWRLLRFLPYGTFS